MIIVTPQSLGLALGTSLSVLLATIPVGAANSPPPSLRFSATNGCPTQGEFEKAVHKRGGTFSDPTDDANRAALVVRLTTSPPDGYSGSLLIQSSGESSPQRQVQGQDCAEVAEALAVVAAIALEAHQQAVLSQEVKTKEPEPPEDAEDFSLDQTEEPKAFRGSSPWGWSSKHQTLAVRAGTLHINVTNSLNLGGGASFGLIPSVSLPRTSLSMRSTWFVTTPGGEQRLLGITRLRFGAFLPTTHDFGEVEMELAGASYGLGLCFSPHYDSKGFSVLICTEYGGAELVLETTELVANGPSLVTDQSLGFGSVAFGVETEYALTNWLHVRASLDGEGIIAGNRSLQRSENREIFQFGTVSLRGSLGLGIHF